MTTTIAPYPVSRTAPGAAEVRRATSGCGLVDVGGHRLEIAHGKDLGSRDGADQQESARRQAGEGLLADRRGASGGAGAGERGDNKYNDQSKQRQEA
ncbi:MAG: hypothetical protein ACRDSR_10725 [Pseudonocardiaceae bacterium]